MYTPGPWTVDTRHHVHAIICQPTRKGEHPEVAFIEVSACQFPGQPKGDLSAGSITAQQRDQAELLANARLIAAAPKLLEALESAQCPCWVHNAALTNDIEKLRAIALWFGKWNNDVRVPAIAKAKGNA